MCIHKDAVREEREAVREQTLNQCIVAFIKINVKSVSQVRLVYVSGS